MASKLKPPPNKHKVRNHQTGISESAIFMNGQLVPQKKLSATNKVMELPVAMRAEVVEAEMTVGPRA